VDSLSGTNLILGPQYLDSTSPGVNITYMDQNGANLNSIFSLSTNVLYPILSAVNPNLVVWHMKEVADIGPIVLSNRLHDLEGMWKACVPNGDIIYIGTPYEARDLSTEYTPTQNHLVREAALRDNRAYVDCMTPCVSYQWMTNNGFLDDPVHPSNVCNRCMANIIWQELGLFTLRTDRSLNLELLQGSVRLRWRTVANVVYELQSSADLVQWNSLSTVPGDGQEHAHTIAQTPSGPTFFRLRLTGHDL
jgi:hypothetical protein